MAANLTKEQLKNELISHGVQPPSTNARKEEFVKLYEQHVAPIAAQKGDFSSDEENDISEVEIKVSPPCDSLNLDAVNVAALSDEELYEQLRIHGIPAGPIVESTRAVYQRKLLAVLNVSLTDGAPAAEQTNGNGNGDAEEHFSDSDEEQMEDEVAEVEPTPVPEPEVVQEPAVVEPVVIASPEPLTAIRKRITGDSRPPSSLSALPLVDRQGTPTPRPSIRSVTSTGNYSFESRRLLDTIDGSTVQPLASNPGATPKPKWIRYILLISLFLAVAYITYTYADISQVKTVLENAKDKFLQYLPSASPEAAPPASEAEPVVVEAPPAAEANPAPDA